LNTVPKRYGRTDGRTDGRFTVASPRSALASRGKNEIDDTIRRNKGLQSPFVLPIIWHTGVKLLSHRWRIRSLSLKLDYTFVRLTKSFTQAQSIPSHRGVEQSVSINSENIEQMNNKAICCKTKSAIKHPIKSM